MTDGSRPTCEDCGDEITDEDTLITERTAVEGSGKQTYHGRCH